ncbi:MAG: hypothetical protein ACQESA_03195 [Patescibacteria group bacterium]
MQNFKKYLYPFIIVVLVTVLGFVYIAFIQEDVDPEAVQDSHQVLSQYTQVIEEVEGFNLKTDILQSDLYLSLTDEYEQDVIEVEIGRVNPFSPL